MLKKQARLLGLSLRRSGRKEAIAVGVVFRGNSWLDGVVSCILDLTKHNDWPKLSRTVRKSKQYSQLHAIMLSEVSLNNGIDVADLSDRLKLPVVAVINRRQSAAKKAPPGAEHYNIPVSGKRISVLAKGVTADEAQEILKIGCTPASIVPEATRVADLITRGVIG